MCQLVFVCFVFGLHSHLTGRIGDHSIRGSFAFMTIIDDIDGAGGLTIEVGGVLVCLLQACPLWKVFACIIYRKPHLPRHSTRGG